MFKGYIPAGAYTAGNNIPIVQIVNTNKVYQLNNNTISITKPGITDIKATIVTEATLAEPFSALVYANGKPIENSAVSFTGAIGALYTFVIDIPVLVRSQSMEDFVDISLQLTTAATIVSGNVNLEYRN